MSTLWIVVILAIGGLGVALAAPLLPRRAGVLGGATLALFALTALLSLAAYRENAVVFGSLEASPLTAVAAMLLSAAGFFVAWGNLVRPETLRGGPGEFYAFLLWGALGGVLLVGANNLLLFFLGLELSSYATYVIAAYDRDRRESAEGGIKYLVLGALASATLLYGFALVYAATGSIEFVKIQAALAQGAPLLAELGLALALVGLGFKLALVPFHAWVPDAYQGARPVGAAYLASAPKIAVGLGLAALLVKGFAPLSVAGGWVLALAVLSFVLGNLWALGQENLKRLLAYSTIAHMGYLALGLAVGGAFGFAASGYYLLAYLLAGAAAFFALEAAEAAGVPATLSGWKGLFKRSPALAVLFAFALLSLAGVPGLAGFLAKLYVFASTAKAGLYGVLVAAVLTTILGYFYYFRVLAATFLEAPAEEKALRADPSALSLLFVLAALTVLFGVWPGAAFAAIRHAFAVLLGL